MRHLHFPLLLILFSYPLSLSLYLCVFLPTRQTQEYVFSFLLSARFFIRSFELLGKLLESIPEPEPLERIVPLLGVWTHMFPYDFRDERMMNHVKHIVARYVPRYVPD